METSVPQVIRSSLVGVDAWLVQILRLTIITVIVLLLMFNINTLGFNKLPGIFLMHPLNGLKKTTVADDYYVMLYRLLKKNSTMFLPQSLKKSS